MSIKPFCPNDKEHSVDISDKFCQTCGGKLKYRSIKCNKCGHAEYPSTYHPAKFCCQCGSPDIKLITTDKAENPYA